MSEIDAAWPSEEVKEPNADQYPLSASAVKKFKRCPMSFKLRYIDGHSGTKGSSKYAELGSAVHEAIERVLLEDTINSLKEKPNQLRELMLGEYRQIDPDIPNDAFNTGLECIEVAARYTAMQNVEEFNGVEREFEYTLARPDIDHGFHGIMDVNTDSEVWDWKTGKNVYEEDEIIQGMIYAMGFMDEFGRPPEKIRFVYLQKEIERVIEPTDENWQKMLDYVRDVVQAKQVEEFPADPDDGKCHFCGFQGFCPGTPNGAGQIEWRHI